MALACSAESLYVPSAVTLWRGSSISVIIASMSRAGQSRAIRASRASLASWERADEPDHFVDVGTAIAKPDQHMRTVARLVQQELGAPGDHLLAERDECVQQVLEVHDLRPAAVRARRMLTPKVDLQRGVAVELVEHDIRHRRRA